LRSALARQLQLSDWKKPQWNPIDGPQQQSQIQASAANEEPELNNPVQGHDKVFLSDPEDPEVGRVKVKVIELSRVSHVC